MVVPSRARRAALPRRAHSASAVLLVAVLALTACTGDTPDESAPDPTDDAATTSAADPADAADDEGTAETRTPGTDTGGVEVDGDVGEAPDITVPATDPPGDLLIVDLVEGDGAEAPPGSTVTTDYTGVSWLNDGAQFDSSFDRGQPATFPLDQVIAGWTEGIPGMKVGGRRLLVIPPAQGYGAQTPSPDIAPNDTLVFVIDLIDVQEPPEPVTPGTDAMGVEVEGAAGEAPTITLPGGEPPAELVVVDLVEGDGAAVEPGATVTTHYAGVSWLNDGEQFDASWDRGEPSTFPLSGVIAGWGQGIPGMREGGRRLLIIPPDLAYGAQSPSPAIAPEDTLVFVIDLVDAG